MSKKKSMQHIENVNIEIDYDKLANAIVKANNKIQKKDSKHSKVRYKIMNLLNGIIYLIICFLSFYGVYYVWKTFSYQSISDLIARIIFTVLFGAFGIVMFLSQQESLGETYEESRDHFNTNLSLVALIVALVALYKGLN